MSVAKRDGASWTAVLLAAAAVNIAHGEDRTIDGSGNNPIHPEWGMANIQLLRLTTSDYADGISAPAGADRPSARMISNAVCAQNGPMPNAASASSFIWQWGQFIDHDIDLTNAAPDPEPFDIPVPMADPMFDPTASGDVMIPFLRSIYDPETGTRDMPRQQINQITAFLDASQVYGSDPERALALRTLDDTGRLATSEGNLLPFNTEGLPNAGGPSPGLFLAGDVRANEQIGLTAMHTLFVREHNRIAEQILGSKAGEQLSGDEIYEMARARVGALMQVITYREFLPMLLGPGGIDPYIEYDAEVNPGIANEFSTAGYRVGHTLLPAMLRRFDADGTMIPEGHLALRDAFFAPYLITDEGGIDPILRGLAAERAQEVDGRLVDDVRNFLFGGPDPAGLDLAALNMQRGRDHGLPSYNQTRQMLGLEPADDFDGITSNPQSAEALASVYDTVDDVDLWIGALAEDHVDGGMVGKLVYTMVEEQFERLRDGDRFWYQKVFTGDELAELESTTLADVIRRNTAIDQELADDVFTVVPQECPADLNGDDAVDVFDLLLIFEHWGTAAGEADIDGSGIVDGSDLLEVILQWGSC